MGSADTHGTWSFVFAFPLARRLAPHRLRRRTAPRSAQERHMDFGCADDGRIRPARIGFQYTAPGHPWEQQMRSRKLESSSPPKRTRLLVHRSRWDSLRAKDRNGNALTTSTAASILSAIPDNESTSTRTTIATTSHSISGMIRAASDGSGNPPRQDRRPPPRSPPSIAGFLAPPRHNPQHRFEPRRHLLLLGIDHARGNYYPHPVYNMVFLSLPSEINIHIYPQARSKTERTHHSIRQRVDAWWRWTCAREPNAIAQPPNWWSAPSFAGHALIATDKLGAYAWTGTSFRRRTPPPAPSSSGPSGPGLPALSFCPAHLAPSTPHSAHQDRHNNGRAPLPLGIPRSNERKKIWG